MHYDRRTLEILLGTIAIPITDEVISLLNVPDEELPPATFHFDTVLDSTAVEKWKQLKKKNYEETAIEVLESGRVDETEERRKRLKCGLADLMKLINDAENQINPVVKIYDEDGDVRVVRKHDKVIERVKAFIRPDETLGEALDRLTEKLRDETELQPAAQVLKREMRLVIDFLETAISEGDRWRDLLDLEQRVLRIQTMNDYRLEVLLSKKAIWDIPGERMIELRPDVERSHRIEAQRKAEFDELIRTQKEVVEALKNAAETASKERQVREREREAMKAAAGEVKDTAESVSKAARCWDWSETFSSNAALAHFKEAYRIIDDRSQIPGARGNENVRAIIQAIAQARGKDESTIRESAIANEWHGHDMRMAILGKAEQIPQVILNTWLKDDTGEN